MNYYSTQDNKGKIFGGIAVGIYFVGWIVIMLLVSFNIERPQTEGGIMMDLSGDPGRPSAVSAMSEPQMKSQPPQEVQDEETLTQDHEDAPAVEQPKPKPKPSPKKEPEKPVEKPREVNKNALFKPRTDSNKDGGDAATNSSESSGKGGYDGDNKGTGGGGVDTQYSVGSRKIVGAIPLPSTDYGKNKEGKVVIEVVVDANGYVIREPIRRAKGSTTDDHELIRVAIAAARKARFTRSENDVPEVGTITYVFKLR